MAHTGSLEVRKLSAEALESLIKTLPRDVYVPYEQSPVWPQLHTDPPLRSHYGFFAVYEGQAPAALYSLFRIVRPERESILCLSTPAYVLECTPEREAAVIEALTQYVRADPDVNPMYLRFPIANPAAVPGAVPSIERGMFEREVVVDISGTPEEIRRGFSSTAKNLINKARRNGVTVREVTEDRWETFREICWPILEETTARNGFEAEPLEFYEKLLSEVNPTSIRLYVAEAPATAEEDPRTAPTVPVGWAITNEHHFRGCYFLAASNARAQESHAMHAVMWRLLNELRDTGNTAVGLTGIGSERWPELASLERYKKAFSKQVVDYPRLHDVPLDARAYRRLRAYITAHSAAAKVPAALKRLLIPGRKG